jgi:hypothetical protein
MATTDNEKQTTVPATEQTETKLQKKKWSTKKIVTVIVGSFVAFIILIVIIANTATSASVKVSNELITDIQAKNGAAAYSLMSSPAKATITESDFSATVDRIAPILNGTPKMQSKEVSGETGTNATAKVVYKISGSDGVTYNVTVNLVKENGQWKVLNFDSTKQ